MTQAVEPTEEDYELGAQHSQAQAAVRTCLYRIQVLRSKHGDEMRPLEQDLLRAKRKLARLDESYRELCIRLRIDLTTDLDLPPDDEDDE